MKEILLHEFKEHLFDGKFLVAFILMALSFLISLGMMQQEYQSRQENYTESLTLSGNDLFYDRLFLWVSPKGIREGGMSSSDTYAMPMGKVKPPSPLLFFARGADMEMRQSVEFANRIPIVETTTMPEQEPNLLKLIFQAPDFLFVVKVLVSLLAVIYGYSLITEELERGTLKLMLAVGASRSSILVGKFVGGIVSLATAFTTAFLIYLFALSLANPLVLMGENPQRVVGAYLVSLLYVAAFFAVGVAVSSFSRRSATALIFSLFFWLLFIFVLPGLSSLTAQQVLPIESSNMLEKRKLERAQDMEKAYEEAHPGTADGFMTGYGQRHDEIRDEVDAELLKLDEQHRLKKEELATLTINFSRVSPAGSLTYLLSGLSNTGIPDVKLYRQDLVRMRGELGRNLAAMFQDSDFGSYYAPTQFDLHPKVISTVKGLMDQVLEARFETTPLATFFEGAWLDFLLLAAFVVIPFAAAFAKFLLYDPR